MAETTTITLSELAKSYGGKRAVSSLDLTVYKGELFGFLGPNGAGKTTTIKMMTGLLEPTQGSVEICGIDMWRSPLEAKRHIAYLPDQPNIYPKLTGWEYLRFIGSVFQVAAETFQQRADDYLRLFNLTEAADDLIESYSHGMKQKIALCGALVHEPDVLILDEPTVGLDPGSAQKLKQLLRKLCGRGMTVFMSTHILEIAQSMCDRVGIITEGRLIAAGTMEELRGSGDREQASLEDIFLQLTGDDDTADLVRVLTDDVSADAVHGKQGGQQP